MTPKTNHEKVPGRGWAVVNAKRHAERKVNPTRKELALRDALGKADLQAEYNVEIQTEEGYLLNFLAKVELRGKPGYIWFTIRQDRHPACHFNYEARRRKLAWLETQDCYCLELYDAPADHLWAAVEQWLMTLNSTPKRYAPARRPGRPKTIDHNKLQRNPKSRGVGHKK